MNLTESQAASRLSSPNNLANRFGVETRSCGRAGNSGRTLEKKNLTIPQRSAIAVLAAVSSQTEAAKAADVCDTTVSEIVNGKRPVDEVSIKEKLAPIRDKALDKVMRALNLLTDDKLDKCSANQLSSVAKDMASVVEKTLPKEAGQGPQINLVVYAPEVKSERQYRAEEV